MSSIVARWVIPTWRAARRFAARRTAGIKRSPCWDQYTALQEYVELVTEQRDRAEQGREEFDEMMQAIAQHAHMDDDAVAEIRAKVWAAHRAENEPDE